LTDVTERFTALVHRPGDEIELDAAALLIAAHAHPDLDVPARLAQLDALAVAVAERTPSGVARALFEQERFAGNTVDYYDPANSYLDDVLDRRLGIPITLSVLMIEVGRRIGVALHGVGMPGHFIVGAADDAPRRFFDPFHGGAPLDERACAEVFTRLHGGGFRPSYLEPVGPRAILDRMLANLQQTLLARAPGAAAWPTRLRLRLPDVPPARRRELAELLGSLGRFSEAASELEALARALPAEGADDAARAAARLRARAT
jgi:regulator of sirC expression with transglutaminase-like and TPR domain